MPHQASDSPNKTNTVLLIEETLSAARLYGGELESAGYHVQTVAHVGEAAAGTFEPGLIVIDIKKPQAEELAVITTLRQRFKAAPVIIMTDHGSINLAVEAMRRGARDFLVRPFGMDRFLRAVRQGFVPLAAPEHGQSLDPDLAGLPPEGAHSIHGTPPATDHPGHTARPIPLDFGGFIGLSPAMQELYEKIEHVARSSAPVFITGESGTGKEVCAEAIHRHSRRAGKPFIPLNCAAIPRDLIESELFGHVKGAFTGAIAEREGAARLADGGTLFLDEIAEMHPDMQTKLLRFLQNQTFMKVGGSKMESADVRIICATNRDPLAETKIGRFREDLYYRLHVLPLHMPPLRDRGDDVIDIAEVLVKRYNDEEEKTFKGLSDETCNILRRYNWPGNIRQLQNIIRNIVVMHDGDMISRAMLPPILQQQDPSPPPHTPDSEETAPAQDHQSQNHNRIRPLAEVERDAIEHAIDACGGNIPRAAVMLGISPSTIYRKKSGWDEENSAPAQGG